jgi:hypothetical protein
MGWVITKQNTSLKMVNTVTSAVLLTNLQVFLQKIDATSFSIYHAAGPTSAVTMKVSEITTIGGSAAAGSVSAIFDQIAALLN